MSDDYRAQVRTALARADSAWGDETGDGDAIPAYIDALTDAVYEQAGADRLVLEEQVRKQAEMLGQARHDLAIFLGIELTLPQAVEAVIDRCAGTARKLHEARAEVADLRAQLAMTGDDL